MRDYWRIKDSCGSLAEVLKNVGYGRHLGRLCGIVESQLAVQQQWRQIHLRLLVASPKHYDAVDRLEAEGEFRFAVATPVLLLGVAIAHRVDSLAPAFIGAAGSMLPLYGGVVAQKSAARVVVNLILDSVTHLPLLDRLDDTRRARR